VKSSERPSTFRQYDCRATSKVVRRLPTKTRVPIEAGLKVKKRVSAPDRPRGGRPAPDIVQYRPRRCCAKAWRGLIPQVAAVPEADAMHCWRVANWQLPG
jgi:hypothetical protein